MTSVYVNGILSMFSSQNPRSPTSLSKGFSSDLFPSSCFTMTSYPSRIETVLLAPSREVCLSGRIRLHTLDLSLPLDFLSYFSSFHNPHSYLVSF